MGAERREAPLDSLCLTQTCAERPVLAEDGAVKKGVRCFKGKTRRLFGNVNSEAPGKQKEGPECPINHTHRPKKKLSRLEFKRNVAASAVAVLPVLTAQ